MCVCVCVCTYVCMHACIHTYTYTHTHTHTHTHTRYEWNQSDLLTAMANLRMYIEDQDIVPYETLRYVCTRYV